MLGFILAIFKRKFRRVQNKRRQQGLCFCVRRCGGNKQRKLSKRDGFGIWDTESFDVKASTDARVLLMEVPMSR